MIKNFSAILKKKIFFTKKVLLLNFQTIDFNLDYQPGQYLIAKIPFKNEKINRLYSIASYRKNQNNFDLLIEIIDQGIGSNYFKNLKIEDKVEFLGPAGIFTLKNNQNPKIFLATGTGLAPIKAMIEKLTLDNFKNQLILFWGLKTKDSVYFLDEFKKIKLENKNFNFKICLSQEKEINLDKNYFHLGRVNDGLINYFKDKHQFNNFEYYICGSRDITESLKNFLINLNIKKDQIFFEKF